MTPTEAPVVDYVILGERIYYVHPRFVRSREALVRAMRDRRIERVAVLRGAPGEEGVETGAYVRAWDR